jgi:hypothetical protein
MSKNVNIRSRVSTLVSLFFLGIDPGNRGAQKGNILGLDGEDKPSTEELLEEISRLSVSSKVCGTLLECSLELLGPINLAYRRRKPLLVSNLGIKVARARARPLEEVIRPRLSGQVMHM